MSIIISIRYVVPYVDPDRSTKTHEQQRSVVDLLPVFFDKIEHRLADLAKRPSGTIGHRPLDRLVTQLRVGCVGCLVEPVRVNGEQITGLGGNSVGAVRATVEQAQWDVPVAQPPQLRSRSPVVGDVVMARERVLDAASPIDSQAGKRCVKLWASPKISEV